MTDTTESNLIEKIKHEKMRARRGMFEFGRSLKPKLSNPRILKQKYELIGRIKILDKLLKEIVT